MTEATRFRKIGGSMALTVPRRIRERLDWKDGDLLQIVEVANRVVIGKFGQPAKLRIVRDGKKSKG